MILRLLEYALYVTDLERAGAFYERLLEVRLLLADERLRAYAVPGGQVLLLFRRGGTPGPVETPGGVIPPHDAEGRQHLAFQIAADAVDAWRTRLASLGLAIESTVTAPRGGTCLYVRDPDGHLVEFATPGVWAIA